MSAAENPSKLEAFLAADSAGRDALCPAGKASSMIEIIDELESLVGQDAQMVAIAAGSIASFAEPRGDGHVAARALRSGATATAYLGRFPEAIELTRNARNIAQSVGDPVEAARALMAGMHPLCETGRVDEAITDGEMARKELLAANEPMLAARVDLNLGNVLKVRGEATEALEHLGRVIDVLPMNDPIRPHALNAIGECRLVLDDHSGADEAFKEAAELLGDMGGLATAIVIGNRADVAAREGRLQDAIDLFADARRRCSQLGAEGHAARLIVEAAEALETAGLFDEAKAELESTLPVLDDAEMAFESARATFALGRLSMRSGQFDTAIEQLDNATRRFNVLDNTRLANRALLAAVEACIAMKRHDEAAVRLAMVARNLTGSYDEAIHAHHESLLHEAEDRLEESLEAAVRACNSAEELGIRPLSVELQARRSLLLRRTGALDEAIEVGRVATAEVESIRGGFHGDRLRAAFLASHIAAHEAYVVALLEKGGAEKTRLAFEVVELARNRGLVERITRQLAGASPDRPDTPEIAELRRRLNALYASLADEGFEDQRRLRTSERQREIDELEIQLDRHLVELEREAPSIDAPVSFEEVRNSLAQGTALLEYFASGDDLVVFTMLDGELSVVILSGATPKIERLVGELHFQCRRRLRGDPGPDLDARMQDGCRAILGKLYEAALSSLPRDVQAASRWLVVPHGPLVAVPFHALFDGEEYVIDRTVVSTGPSAAAAIRLGLASDRGEGTLVATVGDDLAPAIRAEGDAVAALHEQHTKVTRLEDAEVTAERLVEALAEVRVAHIACHGRFLSNSPRSSGLRLADRWFTVRDVHELDATPPVVILSGCETGLHPREGADELLGLTRGFAAGGSRAIVASLWSVHDAASTRLMTAMHEILSDVNADHDGRVADALRQAQLELRVERSHPAFWAPFFCSECPAGTSMTIAPAAA